MEDQCDPRRVSVWKSPDSVGHNPWWHTYSRSRRHTICHASHVASAAWPQVWQKGRDLSPRPLLIGNRTRTISVASPNWTQCPRPPERVVHWSALRRFTKRVCVCFPATGREPCWLLKQRCMMQMVTLLTAIIACRSVSVFRNVGRSRGCVGHRQFWYPACRDYFFRKLIRFCFHTLMRMLEGFFHLSSVFSHIISFIVSILKWLQITNLYGFWNTCFRWEKFLR